MDGLLWKFFAPESMLRDGDSEDLIRSVTIEVIEIGLILYLEQKRGFLHDITVRIARLIRPTSEMRN